MVGAERAAVEYIITGTQSGNLASLRTTDHPVRLRVASIMVLADGKIRRESRYCDMAWFLTQLGAVPRSDVPFADPPPADPPATG